MPNNTKKYANNLSQMFSEIFGEKIEFATLPTFPMEDTHGKTKERIEKYKQDEIGKTKIIDRARKQYYAWFLILGCIEDTHNSDEYTDEYLEDLSDATNWGHDAFILQICDTLGIECTDDVFGIIHEAIKDMWEFDYLIDRLRRGGILNI